MKVTVYLSTYNQEAYVAQALESILMQKTSFDFEVIAADDCSTDRTQAIIMDYVNRHPGKIIPYFTDPNVGGCKKLTDVIDAGLFRGEYLAYLEGDDYWLGEDRLQTLVDFLEANPEYSRVSHKRLVIDENGTEMGFDISDTVLGKPFTIDDFLAGRNYSDFGSVFRNYFRTAGQNYHPLLRSSRNVCDFQDMFITQDFGPVFVMDRCFGVYRSRSAAGHSNYNSITTAAFRCHENIRLAKAVETFYRGKYDLSPLIRRSRKRLMTLSLGDSTVWDELYAQMPAEEFTSIAAELLYLAWRGRRWEEARFIRSSHSGLTIPAAFFGAKRLYEKLRHIPHDDDRRGYRKE